MKQAFSRSSPPAWTSTPACLTLCYSLCSAKRKQKPANSLTGLLAVALTTEFVPQPLPPHPHHLLHALFLPFFLSWSVPETIGNHQGLLGFGVLRGVDGSLKPRRVPIRVCTYTREATAKALGRKRPVSQWSYEERRVRWLGTSSPG